MSQFPKYRLDEDGIVDQFNVAGTSFRAHDVHTCLAYSVVHSEQLLAELVPEPTNKYDPNAIAAYRVGNTFRCHVGYVPQQACPHVDRSDRWICKYIGDGAGTGNVGIIIERL